MVEKPRVLIIYGTRFGATRGIAQFMQEYLLGKALIVDVLDASSLSSDVQFDMYDGILLGSGIRFGVWTKPMWHFLEIYREQLLQHQDKVGVFVVSGTGADPAKYDEARLQYLTNVFTQHQLPDFMAEVFGGVLDFSKKSRHGFLQKHILRAIAKKDKNTTLEYDFKGVNDFRDWKKISKFMESFLDNLQLNIHHLTSDEEILHNHM